MKPNQPKPHELLLDLARSGDVVPYHGGPYGPVYLVNHPDYVAQVLQNSNYVRGSVMKLLLGDGLLSSEGPHWQRQRRLMQPAFHQQSIAGFDSIITEAAGRTIRRWQTTAPAVIDVATEMTNLTLSIIAKALLGVDLSRQLDRLCEAIGIAAEDVGDFACTLLLPDHRISRSDKRRFDQALETVDRFAYDLIDNYRRENSKTPILLSLLLGANGDNALDERQMRDEIVTMLVAGHITATNMLVWTWHLLAEHRTVEERLHAELAQALGGRLPAASDVTNLPYTLMVLQESMRLYPPVWFIARRALADDEICCQRIEAEATVVVSPYTLHRHPAYWEKPEQFDPERFTPELSAARPRYAFIPFGAGPHLCIGNHLAMLEGQLVLATVAQRFRLTAVPGQPNQPEAGITLRSPRALAMKLVARPETRDGAQPETDG